MGQTINLLCYILKNIFKIMILILSNYWKKVLQFIIYIQKWNLNII